MKAFEENIIRLSGKFRNRVDYDATGVRFVYLLLLNDDVTAQVTLVVGRERFRSLPKTKIKSACWKVSLFDKRRSDVETIEIMGEKNLFKFFENIETYTELERDELEDIGLFLELIWSEIFLTRVKQYGLITGSWMSGALLI